MKRRIMAWLLLIGFVLLLANLLFFHWQIKISLGIYVTVVLGFLFLNKRGRE